MRTAPLPLLAAAISLTAPLAAQCWDQHLVAGVTDTRLPGGLGLGANALAFGQPRFDPYLDPTIEDVVRVFEPSGGIWVEVAAFTSSLPGHTAASFGRALDLDGEWLAVGDPARSGGPGVAGAVHLYRRRSSGWTFEQVLQPASAGGFVFGFGSALDLEGSTLVVGAPQAMATVFEEGLVFVYERTNAGWVEIERLAHPSAAFGTGFGTAVDLDGARLLVGAPGDEAPGGGPGGGPGAVSGAGTAQLFTRAAGAFVHTAELVAASPVAGSGLGYSVALEGDVAAAGAIGEQIAGFYAAGRAHVFEETAAGWSEMAVLEETPVRPYHRFGDDVELTAGALYVTASGATTARRYTRGAAGWTSAHRYVTAAGAVWPVSMPVRVRALGQTVVMTDPEGATVFPLVVPASLETGCPGVPLDPGVPGPPPQPVHLDVRGELRLSNATLDFLVVPSTGIGNGLLFYGFAPASLPLGSGTLCVGLPIARTVFGTPLSGSLVHATLDLQSAPVSGGPNAIQPGVSVHFQYWFRKTGGGSHLSSSLVATFCP